MGQCLTTRFLLFLALKEFYAECETALDDAATLITGDMDVALREGISVNVEGHKVRLRFCCCGVKGDLPFLIECGHFDRHFRRAPRRGSTSMSCPGVCHLCLAGASVADGTTIPYEDFSDAPLFEKTVRSAAAAAPWHSLPPFLQLPGFDSHRPGLWRPDIFHNLHLGHGKYFVSSALVVLQQFQPAGGVEARFQLLTEQWLAFCRQRKASWHGLLLNALA